MTMAVRIDGAAPEVTFYFDDRPVRACAGDSVAAALAAAGITHLRDTPASGAPRGFYCMMGACFDCLVEIDGVANRQACMTEVREGLQVRRQIGAARIKP